MRNNLRDLVTTDTCDGEKIKEETKRYISNEDKNTDLVYGNRVR